MAMRSREAKFGRTGKSNIRWLMVFMAFLGTSINYVDRANLGVAVPFIQDDLNLGPAETGLILGAFFWTYAAFQLPFGWLVDKVGARLMYAVAVVWWSVFTAATALARGFGSLVGFRLLLGVGEAGAYPANAKVVSEWFPKQERALATSIFDSGARVGTALSPPVVALIIATFGWRTSFVVTGLLGLVWAVVWVALYRRPREHPRASQEEIQYIEAGGAREVEKEEDEGRDPETVRWLDLFRYKTIWGMMLGFFCLNFVIYFFITWFPDYLVEARGFDLLKLGTYGSIPAIVAIFGGYLGGFVSDYLVRRGMSLTAARKICLVGGMLFASVIALAVLVPSAAWALALLSVSYASLTFAAASVWSLPADVAPTPGHVASIGGIQNFASNLAGIVTTSFTGFMLLITGGSFVLPLLVAGGLAIVGALSYLLIVGRVEPLPTAGLRPASP